MTVKDLRGFKWFDADSEYTREKYAAYGPDYCALLNHGDLVQCKDFIGVAVESGIPDSMYFTSDKHVKVFSWWTDNIPFLIDLIPRHKVNLVNDFHYFKKYPKETNRILIIADHFYDGKSWKPKSFDVNTFPYHLFGKGKQKNISDFPSHCTRCGLSAYVGLFEVAHADENAAKMMGCPARRA